MNILTRAIFLRIFIIITFTLNMYGVVSESSYFLYYRGLFSLSIVFLIIEQAAHMKRNGGRIVFKGSVIPDLAPKDEREMQISGESYKIAFSTVIVISTLVLILLSFVAVFGPVHLLVLLLGIAFVPVSGLMAFWLSYRYQY